MTATTTAPAAPEDTDEDQVAQAEREATEAAALVDALEDRVRDGDDTVTPEQIEQARGLGRFAQLRAEATRRKAERAAHAQWLRQCNELRTEIEGYQTGGGEQLAQLLADAEKAVTGFVTAVNERNKVVAGWRHRMVDLGVQHTNPLVPPASQGGIGLNNQQQVLAGRRRMDVIDLDWWLTAMLRRIVITRHDSGQARSLNLDMHPGFGDHAELYELLAQVDAGPAEPDPNLRFFRGRAGAVITLGPDQLIEDPEGRHDNQNLLQIAKGDLVEISRKEAWGQ